MGCASSKLDADDVVRRCRERRRQIHHAVLSRHHFAAAHSDYLRSLLLAGSSLSAFSKLHRHLSLSSPVLLPPLPPSLSPPSPKSHLGLKKNPNNFHHLPQNSSFTANSSSISPPSPKSHLGSKKNPRNFHHLPQNSSFAADSSSISPPSPKSHLGSKKNAFNFPHLVQNSTFAADSSSISPPSPKSHLGSKKNAFNFPHLVQNSTFAASPSHSSSSNSPASPKSHPGPKKNAFNFPHLPQNSTFAATPSQASSAWDWEKFYPPSPPSSEFFDRLRGGASDGDPRPGGPLREEIDGCRGRFSSSSSSSAVSEVDGGRWMGLPSEFGASAAVGLSEEEEGMSCEESVMKMVVRHRDLNEIVAAIDECFRKAAAAGEAASKLLETGRGQPERSLRHLRKRVYHSNSLLSNLSATLTSKPPLEIRYELDGGAMDGATKEGNNSHCSALEKLLTWEKKLYREVKEREGVKIGLERKLAALQSMERRGRVDEKVERVKASIARLQSQILVSSQAAETTSSAIIKVRDEELGPQLLRLCSGMAGMWRVMNQLHEAQAQMVQQVRGLVDRSPAVEPTSSLLRHATKDLESAAAKWHTTLFHLMQHQRDYVRALLAWLRLSPPVSGELCAFCEDWVAALDRAPDASAVAAVKSFAAVVAAISLKQGEELKMKKRADAVAKELEKKTLALRAVEKKLYSGYVSNGDPLVERRAEVVAWRRKAEEEAERLVAAAKMTREMTLKSVQIALPGVFQAMAGFSGLFADALEGVCWRYNC
ncbi:bZIP domain class transcription factor (DUF630 and DUF632) [Wolffia australiana]